MNNKETEYKPKQPFRAGVGKLFGSRAGKLKKFLSRAGWFMGHEVQEHSDQISKGLVL
jgi:hypothetical protein